MRIKSLIKKLIPSRNIRVKLLMICEKILPHKKMVELSYYIVTGEKLNLNPPKTFNEKLCWYKVYYRNPLMTQCADKYAVRTFVENKKLAYILNELYGVWDNANEINFSELPDSFVMKTNNGCGTNYFVENKSKVDLEKIRVEIEKQIKRKPEGITIGGEWAYKNVCPKIICEEFLKDDSNEAGIRDYKFYCFNGVPKCIEVHVDRFGEHKLMWFDLEWNYISDDISDKGFWDNIRPPKLLPEMIEIVKKLSEDFPHVRVDLYNVKNREVEKIYFGELTFYTGGGQAGIYSREVYKLLGESFILPQKFKL